MKATHVARLYIRIRNRLRIVRRLFRIMGVKPHHLIIPIILSLIIAGLDAVGLGLLAPLAQGITTGDFGAVLDNQYLARPSEYMFSQFGLDVHKTTHVFFTLASLIFAANILAVGVGYGNALYGRVLQGRYQYRLHTMVYNRYFAFGKLFFDRTSQGHIKKILEYTTKITELVRIAQNTLTNIARLIAYLAVMVFLSWQLVMFMLIVFPLLYTLSKSIMNRVDRLWMRSKDITLELGREAFNMLSALPLVWSYSREDEARRSYALMNAELRTVQVKAHALGDLSKFIPRSVTIIALFAVVAYISFYLSSDISADLSIYIVFLYVASRTVPLFKVFNEFWVVISEFRPPILEVLDVFGDDRKFVVTEGEKKFPGLKEDIEIHNLTFSYGNRKPSLQDVSVSISKGSMVALVGPSGAGKSTIISLLMRFYDSPDGAIQIDGTDIKKFTLRSYRSHIALVTQEPLILNDTLHANLTYGLDAVPDGHLRDVIRKSKLESLVKRLPNGLKTNVGDRGVQLSGGEKQRVSIARALLKGSEILLLDEATSALDTKTEQNIQTAIEEAIWEKTAIVIAHRLSTVRNADLIVYMEEGHIAEQGSLKDLLAKKGKFYQQWKAQMFY